MTTFIGVVGVVSLCIFIGSCLMAVMLITFDDEEIALGYLVGVVITILVGTLFVASLLLDERTAAPVMTGNDSTATWSQP